MAEEARRLAPAMSWSAVAEQYQRLAHQLLASRSGVGALLTEGATL
jgi:hypothetical protein